MKRVLAGLVFMLAGQAASAEILTVICNGCNVGVATDPQVAYVLNANQGMYQGDKLIVVNEVPWGRYYSFAIYDKYPEGFYATRLGQSLTPSAPAWAYGGGGGVGGGTGGGGSSDPVAGTGGLWRCGIVIAGGGSGVSCYMIR